MNRYQNKKSFNDKRQDKIGYNDVGRHPTDVNVKRASGFGYEKGQIQHARHIDDIYNKDKKIVAERRFIGNLFHLLTKKDVLHTIFIRSKHPFLYSFAYLTIQNYPISQLFSRMNNFAPYFFQRLLIDYDKYNLHFKYKYRTNIDKSELREDLIFNRINDNVIRLIADFFDINFVINDVNTNELKFYLSRGVFDVYKPVVLMYKNKERHYPLFFNKTKERKSYIITSEDQFKWKLYRMNMQPGILKFRFPSKLEVKLYALKIKELQELAKEYDVSIKKLSDDGKKLKNKTKTELKEELKKKLGLEK